VYDHLVNRFEVCRAFIPVIPILSASLFFSRLPLRVPSRAGERWLTLSRLGKNLPGRVDAAGHTLVANMNAAALGGAVRRSQSATMTRRLDRCFPHELRHPFWQLRSLAVSWPRRYGRSASTEGCETESPRRTDIRIVDQGSHRVSIDGSPSRALRVPDIINLIYSTSHVHPSHARLRRNTQVLCSPYSIRSTMSSVGGLPGTLRAARQPDVPAKSICIRSHLAVCAKS
jgi:hypothetical protein